MGTGTRSRRTLVVDDEDDMRELVRQVVEIANEGLQVVGEAHDGASGLDEWRALRPDVVVVDERMPGMSGLEMARAIRAENPNQCIVLFSAYLNDEVIRLAEELGNVHLIPKDRYRDIPDALWRCQPAS